jgi:hypothetical protein
MFIIEVIRVLYHIRVSNLTSARDPFLDRPVGVGCVRLGVLGNTPVGPDAVQ